MRCTILTNFTADITEQTGILLVSVELATEQQFFSTLINLKTNGRLLRIFIDEIHLY